MKKEITEKGILYTAPMIRAKLRGLKTQTRRVLKVQPERRGEMWMFPWGGGCATDEMPIMPGHATASACPYGKPGTLLWARENVRLLFESDGATRVQYEADGGILDKPADIHSDDPVFSRWIHWQSLPGNERKWRPSIFMPRWASRFTDVLERVRLERVQGITDRDAAAEGMAVFGHCDAERYTALGALAGVFTEYPETPVIQSLAGTFDLSLDDDGKVCRCTPRAAYAHLWDALHGHGAWDRNDWVWVLETRPVKQEGGAA